MRKSARCIVLDVTHPSYRAAMLVQIASAPTVPAIIFRPWSACWRTAEAAILQPYSPYQRLTGIGAS